MLNRRYLRVKVLQALYAYFQAEDGNIAGAEKAMMKSIGRLYDLYLLLLIMLGELSDVAQAGIDLRKEKRLPTEEDLNPNTKFVNNRVINTIMSNRDLRRQIDTRKISWQNDQELMKQVFQLVSETEEWNEYMSTRESSFDDDRDFLLAVYKRYIADFELLHHWAEEQSIFWYDDVVLANLSVIKTIQNLRPDADQDARILLRLYKDQEDDMQFVKELLRLTILNNDRYQELIGEKTRNWEVDRIAVMDVLLMKMGLCEVEQFSSIPVKVSLNEYIELSKNYSTPKSKVFINGVLDKLVGDLRAAGKIKKTGRGLME